MIIENKDAVSIKNVIYTNSFLVMPEDTNYMPPMIFGGKVLAEMDLAAAACVRRALYSSPIAEDAVTTVVHGVQFHIGAKIGDLIFLKAEIIHAGMTSLRIKVEGTRELKNGKQEKICDGEFTFVTVQFANERNFQPIPHCLKL